MSYAKAMSCKLPLLDGEDGAEPDLMTTELELVNANRLQNFGKGDVRSLGDILCTAWGLLLRCYTGQDDVSFHYRQGDVDNMASDSSIPHSRRSTFRMTFDEQESLSACIARAQGGYAGNERGGPSLVSTVSNARSPSASRYQNTHVWVRDANCVNSQDAIIQKVS